MFFDNSPVMELAPDAAMRGVKTVAWFDSQGAAALRLGVGPALSRRRHRRRSRRTLGKGKVFLFGPEITFRAQPHGTFKFLFNSIYYGTSVPAARRPRRRPAPQ